MSDLVDDGLERMRGCLRDEDAELLIRRRLEDLVAGLSPEDAERAIEDYVDQIISDMEQPEDRCPSRE